MQNLESCIRRGELNAVIRLVVSSRPGTGAEQRASDLGLPMEVVDRRQFDGPSGFSDVVFRKLREAEIDLACLGGFLSRLDIPGDFKGRVVNIHPALLPSFGGRGMFGLRVHEAVIAAGCKVSGCTVHFCDQEYDTGPIIVQRTCPVLPDDTPQALADRVFAQECLAYPEAIRLIEKGVRREA